ncbi:MAG: hypothetical protein M3442_16310, partial [Chloroflexota bacterium]|nr:hypothetical protein [Chloroflexota bacterium]
MCLVGPCPEGVEHDTQTLDGPAGGPAGEIAEGPGVGASGGGGPAVLPPRAFPDAGRSGQGAVSGRRRPRLARRGGGGIRRRRGVLGGLVSLAATACVSGNAAVVASEQGAPVLQESDEVVEVPVSVPSPAPVAPPVAPALPPEPQISRLGGEGIVQPLFNADGARVLFYDQPAAGQGGTWAIDP